MSNHGKNHYHVGTITDRASERMDDLEETEPEKE